MIRHRTTASYGDGNPSPNQSWSYDAAGNRSDAVVDGLNRMTASAGFSYTNDVLGNRLTRQAPASGGGGGGTVLMSIPAHYAWDALSRMTSFMPGIGHTDFAYRADGMRVSKSYHSGAMHIVTLDEGPYDQPAPAAGGGEVGDRFARYRYDGQSLVETSVVRDEGPATIRQGLGARGVDMTEVVRSSGTSVYFPVYDAHGNDVASISRDGSGGFRLGDRRSYDAWGTVRQGATTNGPRGRYCASLGHVQDDETGLVYMRARYYEPTSGRFVSEDPQMSGHNWFSYCSNDPVNKVDQTGKSPMSTLVWSVVGVIGIAAGIVLPGVAAMWASTCGRTIMISGAALIATWFGDVLVHGNPPGDHGDHESNFAEAFGLLMAPVVVGLITILAAADGASAKGIAGEAVCAVAAYAFTIGVFMALDDVESNAQSL